MIELQVMWPSRSSAVGFLALCLCYYEPCSCRRRAAFGLGYLSYIRVDIALHKKPFSSRFFWSCEFMLDPDGQPLSCWRLEQVSLCQPSPEVLFLQTQHSQRWRGRETKYKESPSPHTPPPQSPPSIKTCSFLMVVFLFK